MISFLTILGFSLYDTIVVYDRVQENGERLGRTGRYTYTAIMRRSLNQVLMRSINTTITTVLPIISMLVVGKLVFGQQTLADFSLALLIGLISGTYSSLFVASPLTVVLKEREGRWREIRTRLVNRGVDVEGHRLVRPAAPPQRAWPGGRPRATRGVGTTAVGRAGAASSASVEAEDLPDGRRRDPRRAWKPGAGPAASDAAAFAATGHPPRPRKKRR